MSAAPEWRFDPLTGRRVLISPDRGERPLHPTGHCPFCEGHESETPPEVLAYRDPNSAPNGLGWQVRVVPNRYAAVRMNCGEPGASATGVPSPVADAPGSPESRAAGLGVAEVFLECPHHETAFRHLSREQITDVVRAWRDRLRYWRDDGKLAFAQVFKNEGEAAGASVDHCHSQLIALPFIPPRIVDELRLAADSGECAFCRWIAAERNRPLFVTETKTFAVFCPLAPRFPGETWILPKSHGAAFESIAESDIAELAVVLRDLLERIDRAFAGPDLNLIIKSVPFRHAGPFHWRIEILPRLTSTAGWEWGTGLLINTVFPEHAAERLRNA